MNQCKKVYALTVVFVGDFFQAGSGRVNALKPDFRGGAGRGGLGTGRGKLPRPPGRGGVGY
jgi:hypothetical protein